MNILKSTMRIIRVLAIIGLVAGLIITINTLVQNTMLNIGMAALGLGVMGTFGIILSVVCALIIILFTIFLKRI